MQRIIAVANQKGGAGKSTTAVNLSACLAEAGQRVLLVDLDPQASASTWLSVFESAERGVAEIFLDNGKIAGLVRSTGVEGLEVVPASAWLVGVERALAGEPGAEALLARALDAPEVERYDLVLIDCPPSLGLLTVAALVAAPEVLVPVAARAMDLGGLAALVDVIRRVQERLAPELHLAAILPVMVNRTRLAREVVERLRARFGPLVLSSEIRLSTRLAEAPSYCQPINVYDPQGGATADYRSAAAELLLNRKAPHQ